MYIKYIYKYNIDILVYSSIFVFSYVLFFTILNGIFCFSLFSNECCRLRLKILVFVHLSYSPPLFQIFLLIVIKKCNIVTGVLGI